MERIDKIKREETKEEQIKYFYESCISLLISQGHKNTIIAEYKEKIDKLEEINSDLRIKCMCLKRRITKQDKTSNSTTNMNKSLLDNWRNSKCNLNLKKEEENKMKLGNKSRKKRLINLECVEDALEFDDLVGKRKQSLMDSTCPLD